jgi:hypothetical protein
MSRFEEGNVKAMELELESQPRSPHRVGEDISSFCDSACKSLGPTYLADKWSTIYVNISLKAQCMRHGRI